MALDNSVSNSRVSAFRRSGRLRVTTVICGDCFSIKRTGMGLVKTLERQKNAGLSC
jgi:hypothetical protein